MREKIYIVVVVIVFFLAVPSLTSSKTYCVSEESSCKSTGLNCEQCHSLMWYVNRTEDFLNDSVMYFFSGNHYLISNKLFKAVLNISNIVNITLQGNQSTVTCKGKQTGLVFYNSSEITIMNLEFRNCGANVSSSLQTSIFFELSSYLRLNEVKIRDSTGYGLYMNSTYGHITINNSEFDRSKLGNALFQLNTIRRFLIESVLKITFSNFTNGGQLEDDDSAGLSIYLFQPHYIVHLSNLIISNNTGKYGGNVAIKFIDFSQNTSQVIIEDSVIENGVANKSGGGLLFTSKKLLTIDVSDCTKNFFNRTVLKVSNTVFRKNNGSSGGGAFIAYHEKAGTGCTIREVVFENCTFTENTANKGAVMYVTRHERPLYLSLSSPQLKVTLNNSTIHKNSMRKREEQKNQDGIVQVLSVKNLVISNTNFTNNNSTALVILNSAIQLFDHVLFENNSATYGGAIKICESSRMYFNNDTRVRFLNNSATKVGGAIYIGNQCLQETPPCFYQLSSENDTDHDIINLASDILYFDGNHAQYAGDALYGGSVDNCFTDLELINNGSKSYYYSLELFNHTFHFINQAKSSLVTSDPYGACQCIENTKETQCDNRIIHLDNMYPGQYRSVYISAVGQLNGIIPAYLTVYNSSKKFWVYRKSFSKDEKYLTCKRIFLTVRYKSDHIPKNPLNVKIGIKHINFLTESSNYYKIPKLKISITILPCPFIFELRNGSCKCPKEFKLSAFNKITCDIATQTITRPSNVWFSFSIDKNSNYLTTSINSNCKPDQCQPENILSQSNMSDICVTGREGRLCGACVANYSLSLGPSLICVENSEKCSTGRTVFLLFAFILAGIIIIVFLAIFNLTVAEGTINGLLLYANCVYANLDLTLFKSSLPSLGSIFISWLNLDLGFEVCFYAGMTAYQKIWLEFGFLIYLLLLGVMIVCLSRRFVRFTRLAGRNVVPVLATIAFISYPKLLALCISVFKCDKHKGSSWYFDNKQHWIWKLDENIDCYSGIHLVLLIFAVIMFSIALLYTLCLLLIQCLLKGSGYCMLRWVDKLRPFFDAHTGPCNDNYRFWPGFLLFLRLGMYSVFANLNQDFKGIIMTAVCVFTIFLAFVYPKGVYKKWALNVVEFLFLLNLTIVSVISSLSRYKPHSYVDEISIGLSAILLLLIICYSCYKKISNTRRWMKIKVMIKRKRNKTASSFTNVNSTLDDENAPLIEPIGETPPLVDFTAPREELLYDD